MRENEEKKNILRSLVLDVSINKQYFYKYFLSNLPFRIIQLPVGTEINFFFELFLLLNEFWNKLSSLRMNIFRQYEDSTVSLVSRH